MKTFLALASMAALCGLLCSACSSDPARRPSTASPSSGGGNGGGASGPIGGVGNPTPGGGVGAFGGSAGTGGTAGGGPMADPISDFKRDDTSMSGLDQATIDALKAGGGSCTTKLLYPYDETVFPAGLISPLMQWDGETNAAYVKVVYEGFDHVAYEFAAMGANLRIPQDAWNEIAHRTQSTPLKVTLSVMTGGTVDTCEHTWHIARGVMKGTVYYNTYNAPSPMDSMWSTGNGMGAVMRLNLGQPDADVYLSYQGQAMPSTGPCISCHSVSANGAFMAAATHNYVLFGQSFDVAGYTIGTAAQPATGPSLPNAEFAALYPDGTRLLTMGNPQCTAGADTFPRAPNNFPLVEGPDHAKVIDAATGQEIPAQGLNPDWYMWMPQFSPDGKKVVFNHAKPDGAGGTDRRELAVMDYDYATNTFSNLQVIASHLGPEPSLPYAPMGAGAGPIPAGLNGCAAAVGQSPVGALDKGACTGPCYPANPFFMPDGRGVVFWMVDQPDFTNAFPGRDKSSLGELWYADALTKEAVPLENAMRTNDPAEREQNYFTTALPVQVGGYFWIFWTSRRELGNQYTGGSGVPDNEYYTPPEGGWMGSSMLDASKKRIWVAAIRPRVEVTGDAQTNGPLTDPSAPGFYLEGQSASGNVRAFAALAPCVGSGAPCTSGLDCCVGFCSIPEGASAGTCAEQTEVPMCSKTNDRCTTSADCCPPTGDEPQNICLGGFCGFIVVQ